MEKQLIAALKDLVESKYTEYADLGDEVGNCIHCGELSYRPHLESCPWLKAKELLKSLGVTCC